MLAEQARLLYSQMTESFESPMQASHVLLIEWKNGDGGSRHRSNRGRRLRAGVLQDQRAILGVLGLASCQERRHAAPPHKVSCRCADDLAGCSLSPERRQGDIE